MNRSLMIDFLYALESGNYIQCVDYYASAEEGRVVSYCAYGLALKVLKDNGYPVSIEPAISDDVLVDVPDEEPHLGDPNLYVGVQFEFSFNNLTLPPNMKREKPNTRNWDLITLNDEGYSFQDIAAIIKYNISLIEEDN